MKSFEQLRSSAQTGAAVGGGLKSPNSIYGILNSGGTRRDDGTLKRLKDEWLTNRDVSDVSDLQSFQSTLNVNNRILRMAAAPERSTLGM